VKGEKRQKRQYGEEKGMRDGERMNKKSTTMTLRFPISLKGIVVVKMITTDIKETKSSAWMMQSLLLSV
jgi:hypothetical protein